MTCVCERRSVYIRLLNHIKLAKIYENKALLTNTAILVSSQGVERII